MAAEIVQLRGRRSVPAARFVIRRPSRPNSGRGRFTVDFVDSVSREQVGSSESLREAITFALNMMGPGDTLDVRATI